MISQTISSHFLLLRIRHPNSASPISVWRVGFPITLLRIENKQVANCEPSWYSAKSRGTAERAGGKHLTPGRIRAQPMNRYINASLQQQ